MDITWLQKYIEETYQPSKIHLWPVWQQTKTVITAVLDDKIIKGYLKPNHYETRIADLLADKKTTYIKTPQYTTIATSPFHIINTPHAQKGWFHALNLQEDDKKLIRDIYNRYRKDYDHIDHQLTTQQKTLITDETQHDTIINKTQGRIQKGKDVVQNTIPEININDIQSCFIAQHQSYQGEQQLVHGVFWFDHVRYHPETHDIRLINYAHTKYQRKGTEIMGIVWSSIIMAVHRYTSYQKRYDDIKYAIDMFAIPNIIVFQKCIGTLFADYGHLMISHKTNRESIQHQWHDPHSNAKKWRQRTYQLIQDLWFLTSCT